MNINEGTLCHLHFNHYKMILSEMCSPNYRMSQTEPQQLMIYHRVCRMHLKALGYFCTVFCFDIKIYRMSH